MDPLVTTFDRYQQGIGTHRMIGGGYGSRGRHHSVGNVRKDIANLIWVKVKKAGGTHMLAKGPRLIDRLEYMKPAKYMPHANLREKKRRCLQMREDGTVFVHSGQVVEGA